MASESSANEPGTPNANQSTADAATPPTAQPPIGAAATAPRDPFPFYSSGDGAHSGHPPHGSANAEDVGSSSGSIGVQLPYPPMPVYSYGNVMPAPPPMTRPKRSQCKNACTNCQKACKKCDDDRPCQRCTRYGTAETCVDSKRKERKKGVKRGPYKKRDNKGLTAGVDNDDGSGVHSANGAHGLLANMPYVGPVGYPPGMWSTFAPGPSGKLEGGAYYQPVFALTPVGGQPPHGGEGVNASGGSEAPHFPVGFYPATFISYPGPYPPYPMPHGQGTHGFHYPYPPPPGLFHPRAPHVSQADLTNDQGASGSSTETKEASGASATVEDKKNKEPEPLVNGQAKVAGPQVDDAAGKGPE